MIWLINLIIIKLLFGGVYFVYYSNFLVTTVVCLAWFCLTTKHPFHEISLLPVLAFPLLLTKQMAKAGKYSDLFSVINFTWTPDFHFQMRLNVKIWISSPVTQSAISCVTVTVKDYPHCALVHPEALLYYDVKRDINWCLFNKTRKSSDCIISVKCLYLTFI